MGSDHRGLVLARILRKPLFDVIATGRSLAEAFGDNADMTEVGVVLFSSSTEMEVEGQIATIRELRRGPNWPRFVFLTEVEDADLLRRVLACGADAVLSQHISGEILHRSLELVMLAQQIFPMSLVQPAGSATDPGPPVASALLGFEVRAAMSSLPKPAAHRVAAQPETDLPGQRVPVTLSERESQILACLVSAFSNKAIARALHISEETVKVHIKNLLRKVHASNRTQAAVWALTKGMVSDLVTHEAIESPAASRLENHAAV
jgi:two-component system nitrate/nitrite response regulator NarL